MARLPFWIIGDTLSPEHLKRFADYLRTGIALDIERGGADRRMAVGALGWIANLLDAESAAPCVLRPVRKSKNRPKGSGEDWYAIGQAVEELIEERIPVPASASQLDLGRAKGAAIRAVAESHRLTPRAVRALFDRYQSAVAEHDRIQAEEYAASESEEKPAT